MKLRGRFRRFWNDVSLKYKLLSIFTLFFVIFLATVFTIFYLNISRYTTSQNRTATQTQCNENASLASRKMERLENASAFLTGNATISNFLLGEYSSTYRFYYDQKYQFDTIVSSLRISYPEILGLNVYLQERTENMARGSFLPMEALPANHPGLEEGEIGSIFWYFDGESLSLFRRIYNTYDIRNSCVVEFVIDRRQMFADVVPNPYRDFRVVLRDASITRIARAL